MAFKYQKRSTKWYGQILLSTEFQLIAGLPIVTLFPAFIIWGLKFWYEWDVVRSNTLIALGISFVASKFILWRLRKFSDVRLIRFIFPTISIVFLLIIAVLFFTREEYSRPVLLAGYNLQLIWFFAGYFITRRYQQINLATIPFGEVLELQPHWSVSFHPITSTILSRHYDGIVADLSADDLPHDWQKFLALCTLQHIPVYHIKQIKESLNGRVQINHLSENQLGTLLPSPLYMFFKRLMDISISFFILPFILPIILITAVAIKLDSKGSTFFIQERVGQANKQFKIYKLRSMVIESERNGPKLAQTNDDRVTRVGQFIRKTRIDELPQIWNILKGDMSLIGPRPEQRAFVDQFEDNIPFYIYRHVVKPGMTGWAQVMQGYASNESETITKIQYDFYYIKHFSFWLDILIFIKTIRVIVTGFGAK